MRFIFCICCYFHILTIAPGQSAVYDTYITSVQPVLIFGDHIDNGNEKDLPGELNLFVLHHLVNDRFELRLSPQVDLIANNIGGVLSDMAYTVTFENEWTEMPYTAMATLFPSTQNGSSILRKQVCYVEFPGLLESYELIVTARTAQNGTFETYILWKKLPDGPYHNASFEWMPSVEIEKHGQNLLIHLPALTESEFTADVYDKTGRKVYTTRLDGKHTSTVLVMDQLSPGSYQLVLKSESKTVYSKSFALGSI